MVVAGDGQSFCTYKGSSAPGSQNITDPHVGLKERSGVRISR